MSCSPFNIIQVPFVPANLTPEECKLIFECIIDNLDTSGSTALCQAIVDAGCDLTDLVDITEVFNNLDVSGQTALCQAIIDADCDLTDLVNITEIFNNLDASGETALCEAILDAECDLTSLINFTGLTSGQTADLTTIIQTLDLPLNLLLKLLGQMQVVQLM